MKIVRQAMLLMCLLALLIVAWLKPLDAPAVQQVDAGLKRALISFGSARVVSGVISVLQGTQVQIMPAGVGATFTPGQALAPINELVKHFSDIMLIASVSFGIQKVLIEMSSYWAFSLVLTVLVFVWATFYLRSQQAPTLLTKTLIILLMLRFAIPVAALGSDFLAEKFMASDYVVSQKAIDTVMGKASKETLPAVAPAPALPASQIPTNPPPWWKLNLPNMNLSNLPAIPDFSTRYEEMRVAAEQATEHMVKIMAIFLLQTLVIPLLLLWGLYAMAKGIFQLPNRIPGLRTGIEKSPST